MSGLYYKRGESKLIPEARQRYKEFVLRLVRENPRKTMDYYTKRINKEFEKYFRKSDEPGYKPEAVRKHFENFHIERKKDSKGWYRKVQEPYQPVPVSFIDFLKEFIIEEPYLLENKDIMIIPTKEHSENLLCQKMKEYFQKYKAIYIPAFECVVVICNKREDLEALYNNIGSLINGFLLN